MKKHISMWILKEIFFFAWYMHPQPVHIHTALRSKVNDLDQDISTLSTAGIKLRRRQKTVTNPAITQQQNSCSFYLDSLQQIPYHLNYNQRFFLPGCINSTLSSWLNKSALNTLLQVHFTFTRLSQVTKRVRSFFVFLHNEEISAVLDMILWITGLPWKYSIFYSFLI